MNEEEDQESRPKSGLGEALQLGRRCLDLGWSVVELLSKTAARLLPQKHEPLHHPKSGRDEDREMESEAQMSRRERIGTVLVLCFFSIAMLGGIGFLVAYWSGSNNAQWLGGSLAIFLCGTGITLVLWAR